MAASYVGDDSVERNRRRRTHCASLSFFVDARR
jgi:hypothetical protein